MVKNKYKKIIGYLLIIFSLSVIMSFVCLTTKTVNADVKTITDYEDSFSGFSLSDSWTAVNTTKEELFDIDNSGLVFESDTDTYYGQVCYVGYRMTGDCKVEFATQSSGGDAWFAFSAGNKQKSNAMAYSSVAFIMNSNINKTQAYIKQSGSIGYDDRFDKTFSPVYRQHIGKKITSIFDFKSSGNKNEYNVEYTIKNGDEVIGFTTFNNIVIDDGYFGFNAMYLDITLVSLKISESDETKVDIQGKGFENESILYLNSGDADSNWVVGGCFNERTLKLGSIAKLDVSKVGTSAVLDLEYVKPDEKELDELFYVSADILTADMGQGVATGFEVGKVDEQAQGTFAGVEKDKYGAYSLVAFEDGQELARVEISTKHIEGLRLQLVVRYNNTATISLDKYSLDFACQSIEGFIALTTLNVNDEANEQRGAKFDNFVFKHNDYNENQSKDKSINFNGIKKVSLIEDETKFMINYYINKHEWMVSNDIVIPWYDESVEDSVITFMPDAAYGKISTFGPKSEYENYIVRFNVKTLRDYGAGEIPCFGIQFAMEDTNTRLEESSFVGFQQENGQTTLRSQNVSFTNGKNKVALLDANGVPAENIFKKDKTYNIMYVVKNGSVQVFINEESQDESAFEIMCAEVKGVETQGYFQLVGHSGAEFELDDFSVVNLDYNITSTKYNGNDSEIIRCDFTKGDKLVNFTKQGVVYTKDNTLLIKKNGFIESKTDLKNEILRFKTKATSSDIIIQKDKIKFVISETGDSISAIYNYKVKEYTLEEKIDFDGALFEIYEIGNTVTIGYVNEKNPSSTIRYNQFTFNNDTHSETAIRLYADNSSLELQTLSLFDLKPTMTIATRDYDEALDYINPWIVRPSRQQGDVENSSCSSNLTNSMVVIPLVLALALGIILIRRKDEKNK